MTSRRPKDLKTEIREIERRAFARSRDIASAILGHNELGLSVWLDEIRAYAKQRDSVQEELSKRTARITFSR